MEKQTAVNIVKETFQNSFNKERFTYFTRELLNKIDESKAFHARGYVPEIFKDHIKTYERIGTYTDPENKKTDILIVYLQKETTLDRARTAQRNFVARYLKDRGEKDAGLIAFVSPDEEDWRFSFVKMEYKLVETPKGTIKAEEEFTPARRYSFLVGKNENSHTAQSSLVPLLREDEHNPTLKEIEEAFSIERVTKEFFEKYRELFLKVKEALDGIVEKDVNIKKDFTQKGVSTIDFAKKLLGQIVFLYFLQKKGWFGVGRDADWGTGPKDFLRLLFEKRIANYKNFFNDILEPLFYEALANERTADFYSRFNCKIPFLNGGLFDPINNYDWVHTDILLPNELFSNDVKTKESDTGTGILDVFDRYNFTVKEDEPLEKEVAIDPEMLGKVFENLLEVKDRKSKGTYYTPREIVHYMCQESLINYLVTELSSSVIASEAKQSPLPTKEDIETLFKYGETAVEHDSRVVSKGRETETYYYKISESIRNNAELIDEKLANIRVCDPAIGSGAFPVAMMHEIVKARETLSAYLSLRGSEATKQSQVSPRHSERSEESRTPYNFKRHAIQNCLYGVDIDPGAVEIAKLRLWLSLMVDEEDIKHIKPLPNLDYKIVCGNSLIGVEKDLLNAQLFSELETLKPLYFNETNPTKKQEYKNRIDALISKITNGHKEFDFEVYFSEVFHHKKGFDVVIANPPYGAELTKGEKDLFKIQYDDVHIRTPDTFNYFISKSLRILNKDGRGLLSFIVSNNLLFQNEYQKTREVFLKMNRVIKVLNLGDEVFEEAVVPTCVFLVKNEQQEQYNFEFADLRTYKQQLNGLDFNLLLKPFSKKDILKTPGYVFGVNQATVKLLKKVERLSVKIDEIADEVASGISTGGNKVFRISQKFAKENRFEEEILHKVLKGGEINKYQIEDTNHFVIYTFKDIKIEKYPNIYSYLKPFQKQLMNKRETRQGKLPWWCLHWHRYHGLFAGDKILIRQTSDELIATIDTKEYYALNSLLVIKLKTNSVYILKFVLSIINSKICNFIYKQITQEEGRIFAEVKPQNIRKLYIPKISEKAQQPFITLVDQILSAKKKDTDADTSALEKQIDEMVYKLYGLTDEEIKIAEGIE